MMMMMMVMLGGLCDAETRTALQDYMHNLDRLTIYVDNKGGREQVDSRPG